MIKNIILVGIPFCTNLGDPAIFWTVNNIIDTIMENEGLSVELRTVDIDAKQFYGDKPLTSFIYFSKHYFVKMLFKFLTFFNANKLIRKLKNYYICKLSKKNFSNHTDSNTIGVIFVGGGIIKFQYQLFWKQIINIIKISNKSKIPVMFNCVGVESFDEKNNKCRKLKKYLNYNIVKKITVRDDFALLQNNYIFNDNIDIKSVYDPVCFINKFLKSKKARKHKKNPMIGLCICRFRLFKDNNIDFDTKAQLEFWRKIVTIITKNNYNYILFSNGNENDYLSQLEVYEYLKKNKLAKSTNNRNRNHNINELIETISLCDLTINTRLHASILSYSYHIPFLQIMWNKKQEQFANKVNRKNCVLHHNSSIKTIKKYIDYQLNSSYSYDDDLEYSRIVDELKEFINYCMNEE